MGAGSNPNHPKYQPAHYVPFDPKPLNLVGGCQNDDPSLGMLNIRRRIIIGIQKGTIILTTPM